MNEIRFGVIGIGAIGPSHIYAIEQAAGARLGAVCDVKPEAAKEAAAKKNVPFFTDVEEMLKSGLIDAVTISVPSGLHMEPALLAIKAGKHVLVEKPMEITTERIDRMATAAVQARVKLGCVFQNRFNPLMRELKKLITAGVLGDIYSGSAYTKSYRSQEYYDSAGWRGTWALDGGGCLMNQGIHIVDLLLWFMGDVLEVSADVKSAGRQVEVETLALSLVRFRNGAGGVIEGSTLAYPDMPQRLEIFGSRGTLVCTDEKLLCLELIDPAPAEKEWRRALLEDYREEANSETRGLPGEAVPSVDMGHAPIIADFVEAIRNDTEPFIDSREARRSVNLITSIYESGRHNGRWIRLTDPTY